MITVEAEGVVESITDVREMSFSDGHTGQSQELVLVDGMTANWPIRLHVTFWNDKCADLTDIQEGDAVHITASVKSTLKKGTSSAGKPYEFWNTRLSGIACENLTPPAKEQPYDEADLTGGVEWNGTDGTSTEADKRPDAPAQAEAEDEEIPF